jgi:LacI family transcriptional regulator
VTVSTVAVAAGVSIATVSRVMNGSTTVAPDMVQRVRAAAAELGYRPNAAAQGLARGRTGTLGVLLPDLANPYFHDVLKGVTAEAGRSGYRMLVANSEEDPDDELGLSQELLRQTDGLILCSPRMPRRDLLTLADGGRAVVCANRLAAGIGLPAVTIDAYAGMSGLCGHLARLGHRRVVYLRGPEHSWSSQERWRALDQAAAFGIDAVAIACGATMANGHAAVDAALGHDPTAIIAFNDIVAFGALARLRELRVGVPAQVSIAGFDDIPFAAYAAPAITTVRNPKELLGRRSWLLLARVLAGERGLEPEVLPPQLVARDSTAAARDRANSRPHATVPGVDSRPRRA